MKQFLILLSCVFFSTTALSQKNRASQFLWEDSLSSETGSILKKACQSHLPVLVFDNFASPRTPMKKSIDLNGDRIPDIFHGAFVEKLVQTSGHSTEIFNIDGAVNLSNIALSFQRFLNSIKTDKKKYSRINFSQEIPLSIDSVDQLLFSKESGVQKLNRHNIHLYSEMILRGLWTQFPEFKIKEIYDHFVELKELGIPVITLAGNSGPDFFNLFSLMPGAISVGSLGLNGSKRATSSDHSLVQVWAKGVFVSQELDDGFDITGDGQIDFERSILAPGVQSSPISELQGTFIQENLLTIPQRHKDFMEQIDPSGFASPDAGFNALEPGLYLVEDILSVSLISPQKRKLLKESGTYVFKERNGEDPFLTFFEDDGEGRLLFDPLGTQERNQKAIITGTSFAAPIICQSYLQFQNNQNE